MEGLEGRTSEQQELYDPQGHWPDLDLVKSIHSIGQNHYSTGSTVDMFSPPTAGETTESVNGDFEIYPHVDERLGLDPWVDVINLEMNNRTGFVSGLPAAFDEDACMTSLVDDVDAFQRTKLENLINGFSWPDQEEIPAVFAVPSSVITGQPNNQAQLDYPPLRAVSNPRSNTRRKRISHHDELQKAATSSIDSSASGNRFLTRVHKRQQTRKSIHQNNLVDALKKKNKHEDQSQEHLRLACPFFLRDRNKHLNCLHFQLTRVKDVKQHIARKHSGCVRCQNETSECECRMGASDADFQNRPQVAATGRFISDTQKQLLSARKGIGLSETKQWFEIWRIVFPNVPESERPENPYLKSDNEEIISMVRQLWHEKGLEVLSLAQHPAQCTAERKPMDNFNFVGELLEKLACVCKPSTVADVDRCAETHGGLYGSQESPHEDNFTDFDELSPAKLRKTPPSYLSYAPKSHINSTEYLDGYLMLGMWHKV
ncbi:hypothetical protein CT0861_10404 [Colletotrichum tofieldiae]|uniref:Uncharacterized protein n=1 Tax=Colletotrichum tofieldiae TaxID=708197 RepID=A0A166P2P4_9PEZI|nr:hypothetical protein CT0861_10404 [Colletotrichum tofieldiae]